MIRWVLFLLVVLNLAYLAFGLHRAEVAGPYGEVPALELPPGAVELELMASELDPEGWPGADAEEPEADVPDQEWR